MLRAIGAAAVGGTGMVSAFYMMGERLKASWTVNHEPVGVWNHNWDFRDPSSCVKPPSRPDDPLQQNKYNEALAAAKPTAFRHIILVRHGQYLDTAKTDDDRKLTPLGREQADFTGIRLKDLGLNFDRIVNSTMIRATETADIICKHVTAPREKCDFIREGAPCAPEPIHPGWSPDDSDFFQDGSRIEAAFRKYFHRASPSQKRDSHELLVCHGNVIRYFVCRALQIPPEAWLRFSLHHASITWITISPRGNVHVKCIGDAGFMPPVKLSFG